MSKQSKNAKLNMTFEQEFYEELKIQAFQRHLPLATYARQVLMDNIPENKSKTENDERK